MFKSASDRQNDIARTGSHATKPAGTGVVKVLPPEAEPLEVLYQDALTQFKAASDQRVRIEDKLQQLNHILRNTVPHEEYKRATTQQNALRAQLDSLLANHAALRESVRQRHEMVWASVFVANARAMLSDELFAGVRAATNDAMQAIVGRTRPDVRRTEAESKTPEQRKLETRRRLVRAHYARAPSSSGLRYVHKEF